MQITNIRDALDTVGACALDDPNDVIKVTCALMKAFGLPHWELVEQVLDSPHCLHNDCAGELYPTPAYIDRERFTWRCESCSAITVVDCSSGDRWTEPG